MTMSQDNGPAAFFADLSKAFDETLANGGRQADLVGRLCVQAFDSFERNVEIQAEGAPILACRGECAACCTLRVAATAPEVFLIARFTEMNADALLRRGIDARRRIAEMAADAGGLSEQERMSLNRECPFLVDQLCLGYRVRPLACRGHASFDREACERAALGESVQASFSTPHLVVRSLVQNAMMSALRNAGLAWRPYELNAALNLALARPDALEEWLSGQDPLSPAAIAEFDLNEAAETFDAISGTREAKDAASLSKRLKGMASGQDCR